MEPDPYCKKSGSGSAESLSGSEKLVKSEIYLDESFCALKMRRINILLDYPIKYKTLTVTCVEMLDIFEESVSTQLQRTDKKKPVVPSTRVLSNYVRPGVLFLSLLE